MNEQDLLKFEMLSEQAYSSPSKEDRQKAEQQLVAFDGLDAVVKLQMVLQSSKNVFALFFSSTKLLKLFTDHWNAFNKNQKTEMKNFLLNYMGQNGSRLPQFVVKALLQLLGRVTKLAWLEDPSNRDLPEQIKTYFIRMDNPVLSTVGLQILDSIIVEMNSLTSRRTLTHHRKVAVSFRDVSLKGMFETATGVLRELLRAGNQMTPDMLRLCNEALELSLNCMKFDFVGIFPDESTEDVGTIQIPSTWRSIFEEMDTVQLFWNLYASLPLACAAAAAGGGAGGAGGGAPASASSAPAVAAALSLGQTKALQVLVLMSSVRRSLFSTDAERKNFLEKFLDGIRTVIQNNVGLNTQENFHEFCRLMARLKANFQLNEFVACSNYVNWLELVAKLSIESFKSWRFSSSSVYYLLGLWSRLVASLPYLKSDSPSHLEEFVPQLCKQYIVSRMECAQAVASDELDDNPLENEQALEEQLESIPQLIHAQYDMMSKYFFSIFDPLLAQYSQSITQRNLLNMHICEGQLSWLIYTFGAVVGKRFVSSAVTSSGSGSDDNEVIDANVAARVFRCMSVMTERLQVGVGAGGAGGVDATQDVFVQRLEIAVLYFLKSFKRIYLGDTMTAHSRIFQAFQEMLNLPDQLAVLGVLINKIISNLKMWAQSEKIVIETLSLFDDIATGFTSAKMAAKLDAVKFMLHHHTMDNFPFLKSACNMRQRTNFYRTLCKLLFLHNYTEQDFEDFMRPIGDMSTQLEAIGTVEQFRTSEVRFVLMGLLRDLRGICSACMNKRTYLMFFDWFFPRHMPLLQRGLEAWYNDPAVMNTLLKFLNEFVVNRNTRILFGASSPNGILLFKETSKLLVTCGKFIGERTVVRDPYTEKYKLVMVCLSVLCHSLAGNYCNFGVFELYNDKALVDALEVVLNLALGIPLTEIVQYTKLCKTYFSLIEILFHNHTKLIIRFPTPIFLKMCESLEEGVQLDDLTLSSQICSALDHLLSFYHKAMKKDPTNARIIQEHMQQNQNLFPRILARLFNMIIFEECGNQWSASRAMLSLIVTHQPFYEELKRQIAMSLGDERKDKFMTAFNKLMEGVSMDLEVKDKDRFTGNLISFRQECRSLL